MAFSLPHLDRLRLRHLRLLALIDRLGSLRAVGGELNLTQPAVSQMVKDLERAFGATLVERSARGVSLSPAGALALQRAEAGLAAFDHLAEELEAEPSPLVRVGTNPAVLFQLLPAAISRLAAEGAGLRFRLQGGMVNDMLAELGAGNLDCYVGRVDWERQPPSMVDALRHHPLMVTELTLACAAAHPLAARAGLSIGDLFDWPWALPPEGSNNRTAFETAFRNHGLTPPAPDVEMTAGADALMTLARQSEFLICIPRAALGTVMARDALCELDLPELRLPYIQIGFFTLAHNEHMAALQTLRAALVSAARDEEHGETRVEGRVEGRV